VVCHFLIRLKIGTGAKLKCISLQRYKNILNICDNLRFPAIFHNFAEKYYNE